MSASGSKAVRSEDELGEKWDRCIADSILKTGKLTFLTRYTFLLMHTLCNMFLYCYHPAVAVVMDPLFFYTECYSIILVHCMWSMQINHPCLHINEFDMVA